MNVDSSMCASSGKASRWEQINWHKCERQVGRLQARIVKATREGRWGKVTALQRLLTHSFSGKALAVKRVTENQGKRTPGVDSVSWTTPAARLKAIGSLRSRGYRPGNHRYEQIYQPNLADWPVEPRHSWLGQLPSTLCGQGNVRPDGP